jgi:hypothetical protein
LPNAAPSQTAVSGPETLRSCWLKRIIIGNNGNAGGDLWVLICSFIGALFGTALGAYATGRFTEKGKLDATYAAVDKLSHQMGVVTEKTESIKAEIARIEWDRQWRLDKVSAVYSDVLEIVEKIITARTQLMGYHRQYLTADKEPTKLFTSGKCKQLSDELVQLDREWRTKSTRAMLFLDVGSFQPVMEFQIASSSKVPDDGNDEEALSKMLVAQSHLIQHARVAVGMPQMP